MTLTIVAGLCVGAFLGFAACGVVVTARRLYQPDLQPQEDQ